MKLFRETPRSFKLTTSKTKQFCAPYSTFELDNVKNEAILRVFLNFWSWQHQKASNSARLPSIMEGWWVQCWRPRADAFFDFSSPCVRLPRKIEAGSYEVLHLSHHISSAKNWRSDAPKCNPSQETSARTSKHLWWTCLLYWACHGKCIFADPLHMSHACQRFWTCYKPLTFCSPLTRCTIPCACQAKRHLNVQSWSEHVLVLTFWLGNVLRATTLRTFRHVNWQKWSEHGVFLTFWLGNVLRATTACTFSTSQLVSGPKLRCFVHFDFGMCFAPQLRALFRHLNS